jgi:hypothetical protein
MAHTSSAFTSDAKERVVDLWPKVGSFPERDHSAFQLEIQLSILV